MMACLFSCASVSALSADRAYADVRLGGMSPKDPARFGFLGGLTFGGYFDKLVSI